MPLRGGFLGTTLGRRLFARFLLAAFVPASATAALAYLYVKAEVRSNIETRVSRSAKLAGLNTLAALQQLESVLRAAIRSGAVRPTRPTTSSTGLPGFAALGYRRIGDGASRDIPGSGPELTDENIAHLRSGRALLALSGSDSTMVNLVVLDSSARDRTRFVWASLSHSAIWGTIAETLREEGTSLCILDSQQGRRLFCGTRPPDDALRDLSDIRGGGRVALASWSSGDASVQAASWNVFLRYTYGAPEWRVIVSESSDVTFASLRRFTATFAGILLAALLIVFFLSHSQIRKSTDPVEQLRAATRRLEAGDFETLVRVNSGDEFDDLAVSFNRMAQTLDRQIVTLRGLDALHQVILGLREQRPLLDTALARIAAVVREADLMIGIGEPSDERLEAVMRHCGGGTGTNAVDVSFAESDRYELTRSGGVLTLPVGTRRSYLSVPPFTGGDRAVHVFTLLNNGRLMGFIAVALPLSKELGADQVDAIRRLADRLALAVADVQHVSHLAALSSGTQTAFARAIDANSPWTAGHSERVTDYSLVIGARLGLSTEAMATLRCGGLLHDIGKIGVPPHILDKAAPLTESERAIVERHPTVGAEILAPIGPFTDAIPIVRSHHERMNGTGYPDGLSGEAIPFLARVLAVADVFDALTSERPYRARLAVSNAVDIISGAIGAHFDPAPAAAFFEALRAGSIDPILATQSWSATPASPFLSGRSIIGDAA